MARLFGTDGVRGVGNSVLGPEVILKLGRAVAGRLAGSTTTRPIVVVGYDPRPSSDLLRSAFIAGLCSGGVDVTDAGVLPTAGVAFLTQHLGADAGAVITASHNPLEDNGLKLFDRDGYKYSDEDEVVLEACVADPSQRAPRPVGLGVGRIRPAPDAVFAYVDHLLMNVPSLQGLPVTVDCANGASAVLAPAVYREAGAQVREIASDATGDQINVGVGATNPEFLTREMKDRPGEIGLAHDGDADRLIAIDEGGNLLNGADQLAIFAVDYKSRDRLPHDTLVTTPVTNSGLATSMRRHGIKVAKSAIGDRSVLRSMLRHGYSLGGEQYGHIILLDQASTGDGILSALHLMSLMTRTGKTLRELAAVWRRVPESLVNVRVPDRGLLDRSPRISELVRAERLRLNGEGRLIVRMSTIEPVVRVSCEAGARELAEEITERIATALRDRVDEETSMGAVQ
ncbi:phosphoglucosamine mutase [Nonomuraea sp. NPDC046802]|uniref:phosphoglucosamine mutase n=1 Tax=Nonomuraea sp. NPDC046802 TaxID=3154919 RepID=UPI0033D70E9C